MLFFIHDNFIIDKFNRLAYTTYTRSNSKRNSFRINLLFIEHDK